MQLRHPVVGHLQLQLADPQHVPHLGALVLALVDAGRRVRQHLLAGRVQRGLFAEALLRQIDHLLGRRVHRLGLVVVERRLLGLLGELSKKNKCLLTFRRRLLWGQLLTCEAYSLAS